MSRSNFGLELYGKIGETNVITNALQCLRFLTFAAFSISGFSLNKIAMLMTKVEAVRADDLQVSFFHFFHNVVTGPRG